MARAVPVSLGDRSYQVLVSPLDQWEALVLPEVREQGKSGVLVTDETVGPLWAGEVAAALGRHGLQVMEVRVPPGERSKDWDLLRVLYDAFQAVGLKRDGWVLALGGGVVGDLAGFAAATYMRGVSLLQIPTSLLAMCDSSVGGKVGVNYGGAKNLVGAFHQPRLVLTSPGFLETLPDEELANGLAEVIKAAIIGDPLLFTLLEEDAERIWARDPAVLEELIARSVAVKALIVGRDEREAGPRQVLNLGHTLGHALEAAGGFGRPRHGEAVAVGIMAACHLSVFLGLAPAGFRDRVSALIERHRLPVRWHGVGLQEIEPLVLQDKKRREDGMTYVLTGGVGDVTLHRQVPEASIREALACVLA